MKVKELIEILKSVNPELDVVMSKDAEGNSYSPLSDFSFGVYEPESTWSGDFDIYIDEDGTACYTEEESNAICLWPVN